MFEILIIIGMLIWINSLHTKVSILQRSLEVLQKQLNKISHPKTQTVQEQRETESQIALKHSEEVREYVNQRLETLQQQKEQSQDNLQEDHTTPAVATTSTKDSHNLPAKSSHGIFAWIANYFTTGNILVRIGGVILFFGFAFLVKYAAEHSVISIELRLLAIAFAAVALIVFGWVFRNKEAGYGLILQGVGVALLYLVIYGAAKFFSVISLESAFMLMIAVVVIGSILSTIQNALPLALFATAGGFLVPILTSSGDGSHVVLFSYYALLNSGIFIVAWVRSWRVLNLSGFLFTFVIATAWGVLRYDESLFGTTEPFLILFFLMYLTISILYTLKHTFEPHNFVDGTLVFGLPLIAFPLQLELVKHTQYGDSLSALALGVLYLLLAILLRKPQRTILLAHSFAILGMIFLTIAFGFYFDANVTATFWALEGAAIIWLSLKQAQRFSRYFAKLLLIVAMILYPASQHTVSEVPFFNATYLGYLIVAMAGFFSSYMLERYQDSLGQFERKFSSFFLALATLVLLLGGEDVDKYNIIQPNGMLFYLAVITLVMSFVAKLTQWQKQINALQLYLLLGGFFILSAPMDYEYISPLSGFGGYALFGFFGVHYWLLSYLGDQWRYREHLHIASLWLFTALAAVETHYRINYWATYQLTQKTIENLATVEYNWHYLSLIFAPLLMTITLLTLKKFPSYYKSYGAGGLSIALLGWILHSFKMNGDFALFAYRPLLNPLDSTALIALISIGAWIWYNRTQFTPTWRSILGSKMAILLTMTASSILARAIHHYTHIAYAPHALWESLYFQVGLSILWSLLAITLMLLSMRYKSRALWIFGFILLLIVVLKLFVVELSSSGTIERIISFMVVGTLLLLIGYFAPLPPVAQKSQ